MNAHNVLVAWHTSDSNEPLFVSDSGISPDIKPVYLICPEGGHAVPCDNYDRKERLNFSVFSWVTLHNLSLVPEFDEGSLDFSSIGQLNVIGMDLFFSNKMLFPPKLSFNPDAKYDELTSARYKPVAN